VSHQVRVLGRAVKDLEEAQRYIQRDRPLAADRFVLRLLEAIESLGAHPKSGTTPRDPRLRGLGYRFLTVTPYLIFFKVTQKTVRIYRVIHGARRYRNLL
jgi:toxin ParE1/3/4